MTSSIELYELGGFGLLLAWNDTSEKSELALCWVVFESVNMEFQRPCLKAPRVATMGIDV
jgi:hypothetical protein